MRATSSCVTARPRWVSTTAMGQSIGETGTERKYLSKIYFHCLESTRRQGGAPFATDGSPPDSKTGSWYASRTSVPSIGLCGHHRNHPFDSRF